MPKRHKLISLFIAILFVIVLQIFSTPKPIFRLLIPAFVITIVLVAFYNRWYLEKIEKYNFWVLLRPLFLSLSFFGVFLIIPNSFLRGLFLAVCIILVAFSEIFLGNFAENVVLNEILVCAFGFFLAFSAFAQDFPKSLWLWVVAVMAVVFLLARSFYEFVPKQDNVKLLISAILAFFTGQIFWALNFLPFHFSAGSLMLFNIFYFCLILNYYYMFETLNFKKVQFHFILMLACSLAIIVITPWKVLT